MVLGPWIRLCRKRLGTWTLQGWPPPEELQKQLCADALGGSSFTSSSPETASAVRGCILHLQLIQASKRQRWCFWQGRGKHHLFMLCFPNSGSCWAARAALATLLPAGCPCTHGLCLRLGPSDCIYTAKQKLAKCCRLAHPDATQADHSSFSGEG